MTRLHAARALAMISFLGVTTSAIASGCGSDVGADSSDDGGASGTSGGSNGTSGGSSGTSSGSSGASSGSSGTSSGSSGTSSGSSGASSGSSGTSSGGEEDADVPDVHFVYNAPNRDAALTSDSACAQTSAEATVVPLDMYILLDRSSSMGNDCNVGSSTSSKWCRAVNSLASYFNTPSAAGNAAALQYFPITSGQCNGTLYNTPAVPAPASGMSFVDLPTTSFESSLNSTSPSGNSTPMEGAIRGIAGFTSNPNHQRAGRKTIGILITDGDPNGCEESTTSLRNALQAHYNATNIETFVIGMTGASFSNLETIATGGNAPLHPDVVGTLTNACGNGNGPCRHWNVGNGDGTAFVEALKQIQGAAVGCQYNMPTTDAGVINPNSVTVEYLQNGVAPGQPLTRVNDAASCVANGWYYDDNAAPKTIRLCSAQCTAVQADPNAKVRVLLGCLGG